MPGNSFGSVFRITTFGESHGESVGSVIDGCPSGLRISQEDIQAELNRRRPGQSSITTSRSEEDRVSIISGIFDGRTTGTPITLIVNNKDHDPSVYEAIKDTPRPSHADFSYEAKFGFRDWRGGGRSSGRETIGRVAAGAVAKKLLIKDGIEIIGHTVRVGNIGSGEIRDEDIRRNSEKNPIRCANPIVAGKMEKTVLSAKKAGDSIGGVIEVRALGVPAGLGEPVFNKLDGELAKAIMSIGAVKGVEIGVGFEVASKMGSEINDEFAISGNKVITTTNYSGGIQGGISNGMPIILRAAIKPTASIAKEQSTVNLSTMKDAKIKINGRHDPCIVPRVLPVCESMVALVIADHLLLNRLSRL